MRLIAKSFQSLATVRERLYRQRHAKRGSSAPFRIVFVQFGDFEEAYARLHSEGGREDYYAQRYTVEYVAQLAQRPQVETTTVVTFSGDHERTELAPGLWTSGAWLYPEGEKPRYEALIRKVEEARPTHLIVVAPIVPLIRWALARGIAVMPLFADSFRGAGWRTALRNMQLSYVLNDPRIEYVANHNLAAALDLARIGVLESKVLPYDWPVVTSPRVHAAKSAPPRDRAFRLVYVGTVDESKGVGDLLRALALLRDRGFSCHATIIGWCIDDAMPRLSRELGLSGQVSFLGKRPHEEVLFAMRSHDAVVVPSRHEYPEGLPMTLYEALCSRTPLVVSDHPMFALRIRDGENALVFRAADPAALAARIEQLAQSPALYRALSERAEQAADGYLCPLKWDRLISGWLAPEQPHELDRYRLSCAIEQAQGRISQVA